MGKCISHHATPIDSAYFSNSSSDYLDIFRFNSHFCRSRRRSVPLCYFPNIKAVGKRTITCFSISVICDKCIGTLSKRAICWNVRHGLLLPNPIYIFALSRFRIRKNGNISFQLCTRSIKLNNPLNRGVGEIKLINST